MIELDTNNHSVFKLIYHLVIVTKYRRKVINIAIGKRIKEIGEYIAKNYHITFLEYNHQEDHIHILFTAHPNTQISKYLNAFKSASSRLIKKEYPDIKNKLWKNAFWSKSYCLLTTGDAPLETIKSYIQTQGEKIKTNGSSSKNKIQSRQKNN